MTTLVLILTILKAFSFAESATEEVQNTVERVGAWKVGCYDRKSVGSNNVDILGVNLEAEEVGI